jgi:hypothetical protein
VTSENPSAPDWPELARTLDALLEQTNADASAALAEGLGVLERRLREVTAPITKELARQIAEPLQPMMRAAAETARAALKQVLPPNWAELPPTQSWEVMMLSVSRGWSLAWTPSADVLLEILEASDEDAQKQLLVAAESPILRDLRDVLDAVTDASLSSLRQSLYEALDSHEAGHHQAAQALAAATLSTAIHERFGHRGFGTARKQFLGVLPLEEAGLREFRLFAVIAAVAVALDDYNPLTGEPVRTNFNRHATAHRVAEPQYSRANSLTALMLVAALIRELDELLSVESADASWSACS